MIHSLSVQQQEWCTSMMSVFVMAIVSEVSVDYDSLLTYLSSEMRELL